MCLDSKEQKQIHIYRTSFSFFPSWLTRIMAATFCSETGLKYKRRWQWGRCITGPSAGSPVGGWRAREAGVQLRAVPPGSSADLVTCERGRRAESDSPPYFRETHGVMQEWVSFWLFYLVPLCKYICSCRAVSSRGDLRGPPRPAPLT